MAAESGNSVLRTEQSVIGLNHTHIGLYLLKKWHLPLDLENNIGFHHAPAKASDPIKAGIVHLADLIVHGLGIGSSGERSIPFFDDGVLDKIGISTKAACS